MEWLTNLIEKIKIPVKVLLPAACLFSGLLSFLDDKILTKLGLLTWKQENTFVIGLVFLVSICLVVVYAAFYLKKEFGRWIFDLTMYPRTLKKISQMNDMELVIIRDLYHASGYTMTLDWGHPVVKGLLARKYIYAGGDAYVSFDVLTDTWPVKVTLQPFVYRTLNHYKPKFNRKIEKLSNKIQKTSNIKAKQKMQNELSDMQQGYRWFYKEA